MFIITKGYIRVKDKRIYISNTTPYYSDDTLFFGENIDIRVGDEIIYGDGLYSFNVMRKGKDGVWEKEVSNDDVKFCGNTTLHFKQEICDAPRNTHLVLDFFDNLGSDINYTVALSFVERKEDIELFTQFSGIKRVISKIESQKGIENIDEIIDKSSYIMLGRGDLLFNSKIDYFLHNQIEVIARCNRKEKPVIVSTGILTSMETNVLPSRAELIDLILLKELGVDILNVSSHVIQSNNVEKVIDLIHAF